MVTEFLHRGADSACADRAVCIVSLLALSILTAEAREPGNLLQLPQNCSRGEQRAGGGDPQAVATVNSASAPLAPQLSFGP